MENFVQSEDLLAQHPNDIAEALHAKEADEMFLYFMMLPADRKAEVFSYFEPPAQETLLKKLGAKETAALLEKMAPDDRTILFEDFSDALTKESVQLLSAKEKTVALNLLGYPEDCIARLMTPHFIKAKEDWTVRQVFAHIKKLGKKAETLNFVYIFDKDKNLIDDIKIGTLLLADEEQQLRELLDYNFVSLTTTTTKEDAAILFEKYDRAALPVVTEIGVLVGIVTFVDIMDVIEERDTEDIQKIGGMEALDLSYTETPLLQLVKKRAGWLVILFIGERLIATASAPFVATLVDVTGLVIYFSIASIILSGTLL